MQRNLSTARRDAGADRERDVPPADHVAGHGGQPEGRDQQLAAAAGRFLRAAGARRGGLLRPHLLHDQSEPLRPRQRAEEEGRAPGSSSGVLPIPPPRERDAAPVAAPRHNGARSAPTRPFAVVDIGSNSIRLVVYERLCRAPIALFNEKSVCALGKGVATTGRLGSPEIDSALHALRRFAHIAGALQAGEIEYVATDAVRRAENGAEFLAEAERATGRPIIVLSGRDEAHAAAMGVAYSFHQPQGVVGDLGGGSVDLSTVAPTGPGTTYGSLPIGTLPVTRMLLEDRAATAAFIDARLATVAWLGGRCHGLELLRGRRWLAGAGAGAPGHDRHTAQGGPRLPAERRRGDALWAAASRGWTHEELQTVPGMPGRRLETVRAAALLLERVVRRLEPGACRVLRVRAARRSRLRAARCGGAGRRPAARRRLGFRRQTARGCPKSAVPWANGPRHSFAGETSSQRRLRLAVCEVSDSAWREHPAFRAREAFYRLAQYPFIGIDHPERAFLAYAVFIRYEGSPDDLFIRPLLSLLPDPTGAGRSCWARHCSLATASRPLCPSFCRPAGYGSPATSCACTCRAGRRARPGDPASRGCARWPRRWV